MWIRIHMVRLFLEAVSGSERLKSKFRSFRGSKYSLGWRAVDAHNGGLEAQIVVLEGLWIRISMKVKIWIRIRITVMRILNRNRRRNPNRNQNCSKVGTVTGTASYHYGFTTLDPRIRIRIKMSRIQNTALHPSIVYFDTVSE
jgi:hypothetical protein